MHSVICNSAQYWGSSTWWTLPKSKMVISDVISEYWQYLESWRSLLTEIQLWNPQYLSCKESLQNYLCYTRGWQPFLDISLVPHSSSFAKLGFSLYISLVLLSLLTCSFSPVDVTFIHVFIGCACPRVRIWSSIGTFVAVADSSYKELLG